MLSKRTTLAVLCAAALVACDAADSITGPPAESPSLSGGLLPIPIEDFLPGVPVLDPFAPDHDGGVRESARGGGHHHVGLELRTFAFTAKNRADGTTQGQYQIHNRETGGKEHGVVTCLEVRGNRAWIGGRITHSNRPVLPGSEERVFSVIDLGEGPNDPRDQTSLAATALAELCRDAPIGLVEPLHEIEGGNIQVTDGG